MGQGMNAGKSFLFGDNPTLGENFMSNNMYNTGGIPGIQFGENYQQPTQMLSPDLYSMNANLDPSVNFGAMNGLGEGFGKMGQWASQNAPLLNFGAGILSGVGGIIGNNRNYSLMKDNMNTQQNQWTKQYDMQRQMVNNQLADRQGRRVAANPNAESKDEYMKKWGV